MEDILASIRRIIADDQAQGTPAQPQANGARPAAEGERAVARARTPYDDVLDLARMTPAPDRDAERRPERTAVPALQGDDAAPQRSSDLVSSRGQADGAADGSPAGALRARLPEPVSRAQGNDEDHTMLDHTEVARDDEGELLSAPLGASVLSAFETLAATVVLENTPMLERVMRDLLRPMLKTWLDDNLPGVVERLVRGEIERVARGVRD